MKQKITYQQIPLFDLGQIVTTPQIPELLRHDEIAELLRLHIHGQWDGMHPQDAANNREAVGDECRIHSVYKVREHRVWVITEADRSYTTVLFPSDY